MIPTRYLLPAALGLVAAGGNYLALSKATATVELVALRADVPPGTPLRPEHLKAVGVRGDAALFAGAVRWDQREAVDLLTLRRAVKAGELLLRADLEHAGGIPIPPPEGYQTLTLAARPAALLVRPDPGEDVVLFVRPPAVGPPVEHGPFRYLGATPVPAAPNREPDTVLFRIAIAPADARKAELVRAADGGPDRVARVEVVKRAAGGL